MKQIFSIIKPYIRWVIFGVTLFFVIKAFKDRWQEVAQIEIESQGLLMLLFALIVTIISLVWAGWVWGWILKALQQSFSGWWAIRVFLVTNISKYLPGNLWHLYGRISAVASKGTPIGIASVSVLLEPLLMVASGLLVGMITSFISFQNGAWGASIWGVQILSLIVVLVVIHPKILNRLIGLLNRIKVKNIKVSNVEIKEYFILPLLGQIGFVLLRGGGFIFAVMAFTHIDLSHLSEIYRAFSFAWLCGLVIPGAPGGVGVFEFVAIKLLDDNPFFSGGVVLTTVALFRLISVSAEALSAFLGWLSNRLTQE